MHLITSGQQIDKKLNCCFHFFDYLAFEFLTIKIFLNLRGFEHKNIIFGIIWSASKIRAVGQNIFLHLRSGVGLSVFLGVCLLVCFCLFSCLYIYRYVCQSVCSLLYFGILVILLYFAVFWNSELFLKKQVFTVTNRGFAPI